METRPGTKLLLELPEDEVVVSMTTMKDRVYIATNRRVFYAQGDTLIQLTFEVIE